MVNVPVIFLSERREISLAHCLAGRKGGGAETL